MKLILRDACYNIIKSKTNTTKDTEEHKEIAREANERIKIGRLKYIKAYENAKDYYK